MEPVQPLNPAVVKSFERLLGPSSLHINMFEEHSMLSHQMASYFRDNDQNRPLPPLIVPQHKEEGGKPVDLASQELHGLSNDSIRTDDTATTEKSPVSDGNQTPTRPASNRAKNPNGRSKPAAKRASKAKIPGGPVTGRAEKRAERSSGQPKKRQPRPRKIPEEPIHQESVVVDNQAVVELQDVPGDLEFEDLDPEDLEVVRYLPPPGNMRIVGSCAKTLMELKEFERRLQDILHTQKDVSENDPEHDSDATLSAVLSDDTQADPVSKLSLDMAMLTGYKVVFDPPVPAVITIPISTVQVNSVNDWETEARALQCLLKKPDGVRKKEPVFSRKRKRAPLDAKRNDYIGRLIAGIEIKSNQAVYLRRPVFSLQQPFEQPKKPTPKCADKQVELPPNGVGNGDVVKKAKVLGDKLELEALCEKFMDEAVETFEAAQLKELQKAAKQRHLLENEWRGNLLYSDPAFQKSLHETMADVQAHLKRLTYGKARSTTCVDEKCALDMDELEKRTGNNTEKAKSHVTNMFEENRRQFDLQRTLDFATCKCDMLAINTRNMRKRADVMPQYARLFEEAPVSAATNAIPGSPPHNNQANAPASSAQNVKRRRNNFATSVRETLDEREIYDDLMMINRIIKEDPDRVKAPRLAEVVPDNNRLNIDGKWFHRNQEVNVEHFEQGKFAGLLVQFTQTEIMVKRTADGSRLKFPLGLVMEKKLVLKKRSAAARGSAGNSGK